VIAQRAALEESRRQIEALRAHLEPLVEGQPDDLPHSETR
jgi:hypothetical protein